MGPGTSGQKRGVWMKVTLLLLEMSADNCFDCVLAKSRGAHLNARPEQRYFTCDKQKGIFVRPDKCKKAPTAVQSCHHPLLLLSCSPSLSLSISVAFFEDDGGFKLGSAC